MNKRLKQALGQSFAPPPPRRREIFLQSLACPRATPGAELLAQAGFIRKRVWLCYIAGLAAAYAYTRTAAVPQSAVGVISAMLPLLSLCAVAEIYKSSACGMEEIELACRFNLQKITLMRLCILSAAGLALLTAMVALMGGSGYGTLRNALYISVPTLLSGCISLGVLTRPRSGGELYICAAVGGGVSVLVVLLCRDYRFVYRADFTALWLAAFAALSALSAAGLAKFIKAQEELQWSLL